MVDKTTSKSQKEETFLEILKDLVCSITDAAGIPESLATEMANEIIENVQIEYGSRSVYIHAKDRAEKKRSILDDWRKGIDKETILEKYDISERRYYQILSER